MRSTLILSSVGATYSTTLRLTSVGMSLVNELRQKRPAGLYKYFFPHGTASLSRTALLGIMVVIIGVAAYGQSNKSLLLNSRHDFSVRSSATIRATTEDKSCTFCHAPHDSTPSVPLWNHAATTAAPQVYSSTTLRSAVTQATAADSSKLCLSCHDGTIALGDTVNNGIIAFIQGANYKLPASSAANLNNTVGFADDHPFAFVPTTSTEIVNPPLGNPVKLYGGRIQCVSCHDPHVQSKDVTSGKFLVGSNARSAICLSCHVKPGWDTGSHRQPTSPVNDGRYDATEGAHTGYIGVANNGCETCHRPHSPAVGQRLIKFLEENACYKCHNGSVAETARNIQSEFQTKTYRHPVYTTPSVHDASEGPASVSYRLPETSAGAARHAECPDCHNSHAANTQTATPPAVNGFLRNVNGITSTGAGISPSAYEYQICLKCHGDSANKPQLADTGNTGIGFGRNPKRQVDQGNPSRYNVRLEYTSTIAWHPVMNPRGLSTGTSGDVPSLRPAQISSTGQPLPGRTLSATSLIYCTDCHSNNTGRNLGTGTGPAGPHGSNIVHLLERTYSYNTPPLSPGGDYARVSYSPAAYALCDKCHDVNGSIVQNQSFRYHNLHIRWIGASCAVCHDAHGINGGNAVNNKFLINFDTSIVGPTSSGALRWESTGLRRGRCYLVCHGENHNPESY